MRDIDRIDWRALARRPPKPARAATRPCRSLQSGSLPVTMKPSGGSAMGNERVYRIFLSSPGDVMPERQRVARVVERLNAELAATRFEVVRWEESFYTATKTFQEQIPRPSEADIVLCI